jgi:hypothetical protein
MTKLGMFRVISAASLVGLARVAQAAAESDLPPFTGVSGWPAVGVAGVIGALLFVALKIL